MLVLSRKVREQICLPGLDVVVTVLEVRGRKVRLGITAPDEITIVREELWRRLQQDSVSGLAESTSTKPLKPVGASPLMESDLGSLLFPATAKLQRRNCV